MNTAVVVLTLFLTLVATPLSIHGLSGGAPAAACTTLTQQHPPNSAQTSAVPYTIDLSVFADGTGGFVYLPGTDYNLMLESAGGEMQFRGFLIQARLMSDDTTVVGSFSSPPSGTRLSSCTPPESAITHNNSSSKSSISVTWTTPPSGTGAVRLAYAVTEVYDTFWADQRTAVIQEAVNVAILRFSQSSYSQLENMSPLSVNVVLDVESAMLAQDIVVRITASAQGGDTATDGVDFTGVTCEATFPAGSGPGTLSMPSCFIAITNDSLMEPVETFSLDAIILDSNGQPAPFTPGGDSATAEITDDDDAILRFSQPSYSQLENMSPLSVNAVLDAESAMLAQDIVVQITASAQGGDTATDGGVDFTGVTCEATFPAGSGPGTLSMPSCLIAITNDLLMEPHETFSLDAVILDSNGQPAHFTPGGDSATAEITDDDGGYSMGGDPHFSIVLPDNHILCYTVQGEYGSVFNLISSKHFHMNALFVPTSGERNATWIGAVGVVIGSSLKSSNVTKITINATGKSIYVGDGITLPAKDIHELHLQHGELLSYISNTQMHIVNPRVKVILEDVGLQFTVRFQQKHLEVFWQSMGTIKDSHGLIGQFLRSGVRIDHIQKVLIFPDKNPVPVKQRSVWGYMKHEFHELDGGKRCWATMKHGEQGEGLIDGTYMNYKVKDILSTDFQFKPNKHTL